MILSSDPSLKTLQWFVLCNTMPGATIYTDEHSAYDGLPNHTAGKHGAGEFVNGMEHANGVESFWSLFKLGFHGTFHKMSAKHLNRYLAEYSGRQNIRGIYTIKQMGKIARGLGGKRLSSRELVGEGAMN